jgi:hypothetical protein
MSNNGCETRPYRRSCIVKRITKRSLLALTAILAACSAWPMSHDDDDVAFMQAVSPANGATVATTAVVSITFSRAMMQGMETLIVLHEGSVTGPVVSGSAVWSEDRRTMTFSPAVPLQSAAMYVLHVAPGVRSADGGRLDHGSCAGFGAQSVGPEMMGNGGVGAGMMGSGWQMSGGTYGMIFTFTTA